MAHRLVLVPFGAIVWQWPLPGALQGAEMTEMSVVVAVRDAPRCLGRDLRGEYQDNGPTTGNSRNGAIRLRAVAPRPRSLAGLVRIVGRDSQRRRVTDAVTFRAPRPIALSPATRAVPSRNAGTSAFEGSTHGDVVRPLGVTCDRFVQPATWLVSFGDHDHVSVANRDPRTDARSIGAFYSCRGNVGAVSTEVVFHQG